MQKDRFYAILADLDQITDEDIKSLNQLRKQHPYFQNQYVMIAKALKDRDHPKVNAFVKKAAIYVADRGLLKGIVTGTHDFAAPSNTVEATPPPAVSTEEKNPTKEVRTPEPKEAKAVGTKEAPASETAPAQVVTEPKAKPAPETRPVKPEPASSPKTDQPAPAHAEVPIPPTAETPEPVEDNQEMINELEKDLKEIKEKKRLLAKLLEQGEAKTQSEPASTTKKPRKKTKKNQSELIEKFIQNEPQMEKHKLASDENSYEQVDLASENIRQSDKFYTETLAKLMVKQKKYKKAVEIYEKLRLKFPEKRAYFASQIEKVKEKSNV